MTAEYQLMSQEYAQGAIKASILINSGAAIVLLGQLPSISHFLEARPIGFAFLAFSNGIALASLAWLCIFFNARRIEIALRKRRPELKKAKKWQHTAVTAVSLSIVSFLLGCYRIGLSLLGVV